MTKPVVHIGIECAVCHIVYGAFPEKEVPKSFICAGCGVGQATTKPQTIGFTPGRNETGHVLPPGKG